jgi:DNA polymerase-3 subunit gamma/tau
MLTKHLGNIAAKENVKIDAEALSLIAVAAEGSVRDSLSLLDQAIARGAQDAGDIQVTTVIVRSMIGAADNTATFRLLETLLKGDVAEALSLVNQAYIDGADPLLMLQDCLEVTHLVTRVKVAPVALTDVALSEHDRKTAQDLAQRLPMPVLARLWQMFLKGVGELRAAPSPLSALEMLLVRIAYAATLPTPAEVIRTGGDAAPAAPARSAVPAAAPSAAPVAMAEVPAKAPLELVSDRPAPIESFADAVALFEKNREILVYSQLRTDVRLVSFASGRIEIRIIGNLARDFGAKVADCLTGWTGQKWQVVISQEEGEASLHEQEMARKQQQEKEVSAHPLVASVLEQFPGAKLMGVQPASN